MRVVWKSLSSISILPRVDKRKPLVGILRTSQPRTSTSAVHVTFSMTSSSLSLSGKWYFNTTDQHGRHSILFGAYKGFLRNVTQRINEETLSLSHEYDRGDYGIVAGYEYLHPFGNGLSIGTGLQSRFGLNNIFSGNDIIPGYLNRTRIASINITISLRYNPN